MNGDENPRNGSYTWALTNLSDQIKELRDSVERRIEQVDALREADVREINHRISDLEQHKMTDHAELYRRVSMLETEAVKEAAAETAVKVAQSRQLTVGTKIAAALGTIGIILGELFGGRIHL